MMNFSAIFAAELEGIVLQGKLGPREVKRKPLEVFAISSRSPSYL